MRGEKKVLKETQKVSREKKVEEETQKSERSEERGKGRGA